MDYIPKNLKTIRLTIETALRHQQKGQLQKAKSLYKQVLAIDPDNFDALHLSGVLAHQAGDNQTAINMIEMALKQDKANPFAFNNLGEAYRSLKRLKEAEHCYRQAIALKPDYFEAYNNLGNNLKQQGRLDLAVQAYRQAISIKPEHFGPYNNLGNVLASLGQLNDAEQAIQQALCLNPDYAEAHNNLGNILLALGQPERAEQSYRHALTLRPDYATPYNNLGKLFLDRGQRENGLEAYYKAIALQPDYDEPYYNLGTTFMESGRLAAAEQAFNQALVINPDYASCKWNLSLLMLLQGRLEEGFRLYENRFIGGDKKVFEKMNGLLAQLHGHARWQGEPLLGKSLMLIAEQGLGDNLMMIRYLPLLKSLGCHQLIVYCEPPLIRLFLQQPAVDAVVPMSDPLPFGSFDLYCPSMSLPHLFQTRLQSIPCQVPYLAIPEDLQQHWQNRFADVSDIKVGLVWAGKGSYVKNQLRSMSLEQFSPLLDVSGVRFVSLQKGDEKSQLKGLGWDFIEWIDECNDLLDSAALINQLDLVISVDTSVAHLAGALGKPVWLLNRFGSEWRWLLDREDSPWYQTMRIFRQKQQDSWTDVINQIAISLQAFQKSSGAGIYKASTWDNSQGWFEQGIARIKAVDYVAAEACFRNALKSDPQSLNTQLNLGYVLGEQGRYDEAISCYNSVLSLSQGSAEARYNRAALLLRRGDFKNGFNDYEARFVAMQELDKRTYSQPLWDGSPLNGRTILVYCEQGLGDTIMFARFVPLLARLEGHVVLEVQQPLVSLLSSLPGVESVIEKTSTPPLTDCYIHLLSLPHLFQTTLESLPHQVPYINAPAQLVTLWKERIEEFSCDYRIGLVWACKGRPFPNRTCPAEHLAPLLSLSSISFFSLQVGEKDRFPLPDHLACRVIDVADDFRDFADTAAFIMNLDLVITVDAAVAHLAGAMGKPVWVMLPRLSDWRWMLDRNDSPWYPTMRLFRQPTEGDWPSVISEITLALQEKNQTVIGLLRLDQMDINNCYDLGVQLKDNGDLTGAEQCFRRIVSQAPELPDPQHSLGVVLQLQGRLQEAIEHYRAAITLDPYYVKARYNLADALSQCGLYQEAISSARAALQCDPTHTDAHWLLGMLLLLHGDFLNGWREYEWRWQSGKFNSRIPELGRPLWDGSPLAGRTLLIHMEQGRGDMIQFVRFASLAAATGGPVVVCALRELVPLLATVNGVSLVVDRDGPLPDFDVHISVQSLPRVLGTTLETIPDKIPYLTPDQVKVEQWRKAMSAEGRFRVGLAWQGTPTHKNDHNRSCTFAEFKPLGDLEGVAFYSLQLGAGAEQCASSSGSLPLIDLTENIHDFSDTAALIANLDLVISVDTAVAHLAGALGKQVWTLLPFVPEWRWLLDRRDSPWYPTMLLFRQPTPGDWPGVIALVKQELSHLSGGAEFHNRRGIELLRQGVASAAEVAFSMAIHLDTNNAEALCNRGVAQDAQHKFEEALDSYTAAIVLRPDYMQAFFNMGNTLMSMGKLPKARACYEQTIKATPDFMPAHLCLGEIAKQQGEYNRARASYEHVLSANPSNVEALQGLAETYQAEEKFVQAIKNYRQVLDLEPERASSWNLLGTVYHCLERLEEAESCYRNALQLLPDRLVVLNNLGVVLNARGRLVEAISVYRHLLSLDNTYADGHWNLSIALLAVGEYQEGFREYEWRFKKSNPEPEQSFIQPRWDGSDLAGKTILLHSEQGFGDTIQFVRYAPLVAQRGGKVIIECQVAELKRLLTSLEGVSAVVAAGEHRPHFDCHLSILSLPRMFCTTLETIPSQTSYLAAEAAVVEMWRQRLGGGKKLRVGLAWFGRQSALLNRKRSCPLEAFAPLVSIPNVEFYTLQVGDGAEQLAECPFADHILNYSGEFQDFADTAAFIMNLDLVITIDSAIAHLAGAVGVPTWTLLPFGADWRWQLNRQDSPWYPTMRLFRQSTPGDWPGVIDTVTVALKNLAQGSAALQTVAASPHGLQHDPASEFDHVVVKTRVPRELRIGLAWSCRKDSMFTINRICPFSALTPLFDIPGVRFFSLQLGETAEKPAAGLPLIDLTGHITDFEDTAALVANLDLIISIDTAVAHLSGAMGRPTWVLLPYVADWRWQLSKNSTPWYPGMRLFRQPDFGDWASVIREVAGQLGSKATNPSLPETSKDSACMMSAEQQALEQALVGYMDLAALIPDDPDVHLDLGVALAMLGRFDEAIGSFRRVLALDEEHIGGHQNLAFALLTKGDYREGWQHYQWRLRGVHAGQIPPWPILQSGELGTHRQGTSLLVHCEQGYGDTIMFSRFLPLLADAGYRVVISCQPPLASLVASLRGVSQVVAHGEILPLCERQIMMLSLPYLFDTTPENVPATIPYLTPRPQVVETWKNILGALPDKT